MTFAIAVTFLWRLSLVLLFLPFSALDKVLNFRAAVGQAVAALAPADQPLSGDALANLWEPVPGDFGAHGRFDARAGEKPPDHG